MGLVKTLLGLATAGVAVEYSIAWYFFRRTLVRGNMPVEKTTKMAGTDWSGYIPEITRRAEWLARRPKKEKYCTSRDGLRLHATWFPAEGARRTAIVFHGYTSKGMDSVALAHSLLHKGFNVLLPDARAHGDSEGKYIGFGVLDRWDALKWIEIVDREVGGDILLHGTSMGGATVLMAAGQPLPPSVKGIVADCAFTSAWDVFEAVLGSTYHMPAFPILHMANGLAKSYAGYDLAGCNAAEEVKKMKIPLLLIHGEADTFVPSRMCREIHQSCPEGTGVFLVPGAGHGEAYYKDTAGYEARLDAFLHQIMETDGVEQG